MTADIERIIDFIVNSFTHVWPYLLLSIPLAVGVKMSGASRHIKRAFDGHPTIAILLAVGVGAFSPFCSCGVIPVVASLLVGGVPLAPVMAFWIASPSMDPEIFFLSVASLGWNLAIWRLAATLAVSLLAGYVTHFAERSGWLGEGYLRLTQRATPARSLRLRMRRGWLELKGAIGRIAARPPVATAICCTSGEAVAVVELGGFGPDPQASGITSDSGPCESCEITDPPETTCDGKETGFRTRLLLETAAATWMVGKFMALAFFLGALIQIYIPAGDSHGGDPGGSHLHQQPHGAACCRRPAGAGDESGRGARLPHRRTDHHASRDGCRLGIGLTARICPLRRIRACWRTRLRLSLRLPNRLEGEVPFSSRLE
jgi:uncharacterized membrane protein YraQ (UPF0718 family)